MGLRKRKPTPEGVLAEYVSRGRSEVFQELASVFQDGRTDGATPWVGKPNAPKCTEFGIFKRWTLYNAVYEAGFAETAAKAYEALKEVCNAAEDTTVS